MSWLADLKCGDPRCGCSGHRQTYRVSLDGVDLGDGWILGPAGRDMLARQQARVITGRPVSVGPVDRPYPQVSMTIDGVKMVSGGAFGWGSGGQNGVYVPADPQDLCRPPRSTDERRGPDGRWTT